MAGLYSPGNLKNDDPPKCIIIFKLPGLYNPAIVEGIYNNYD